MQKHAWQCANRNTGGTVRQLPSGIRNPAHKTCLALMCACVSLPQTVEAAWQHVLEEAAHELIAAEAAGSPVPKVSLACSVNQE
jgi:hypothetical protein